VVGIVADLAIDDDRAGPNPSGDVTWVTDVLNASQGVLLGVYRFGDIDEVRIVDEGTSTYSASVSRL
jgi:hypothetical protein